MAWHTQLRIRRLRSTPISVVHSTLWCGTPNCAFCEGDVKQKPSGVLVMAPAGPPAPPPRVEELVLRGADVSVLNHTTLSLWHFRQLALEMLPGAEPEDDQDRATAPEASSADRPAAPHRGIELGEGMSVAAVLFEQPSDVRGLEKSGPEPAGGNCSRTERLRPTLQLQGVTISVRGQLTPDTRVAAVFQRYRCVLCLDASPSILSIDPSSGRLFLDLLYESVELFIWSLLRPMEVGGVAFTPEIHASVLVQGALVESLCVIMQGYIVTPSNAASFLQLIKDRFQLIENNWASQAQELGQWGYIGNATPASLDWILQNAVFALNSLPADCAPMMVLVTDGVVDVRDAYSYDNLLMQLVRHDIQCHFLRIGGGGEDELSAAFGFVPDTHLLRFVAEYTGGTVFDYTAIHEACYGTTSTCSNVVKKMTGLQDSCFLRKSNVHANSAPVVKLNEMDSTSFDGRTLLPLRPYRMWREKVHEYRIFADVNRIVEARLCEGFSINKVHVKTYQQPVLTDGGSNQTNMDSAKDASNGSGVTNSANGHSNEVTKILIVFLLQWKQNVWLEYVLSTTTESSVALTTSVSTASHPGRRLIGQGLKGSDSSSSARKPRSLFSKDQRTAWSEWYVKMNILAYADFLRAFDDSRQHPSTGNRSTGAPVRGHGGDISKALPLFVHDFIRNVQDVDRVLLHLMTATASISDTSDSVANQFSFGTSANSSSASVSTKITSSHPVFNIIGELSTVLWHRWFSVERFEILCVVKSDACTDLFYRTDMHGVVERGNTGAHLRGGGNASQGMIHSHGANAYGTNSANYSIGVESLAEPLVAILVKWSSQKLSQDLFLKFLCSTSADKSHAPPRAKASPSSSTSSGGIAMRRRQRGHNNNGGDDVTHGDESTSAKESKAALCFVRLEFKNKTLCAIHVAFFATRASTRRQVLNDLKSTIFVGINEVVVTPSPAKLLSSSMTETSVILCHRMLSRLLVTHDTLLLHGIDQEPGPFDYYVASPTLEAEKNAGAIPPSSTCCGGSELQLHRVFGAYVWHSSWKWEVANLTALLDVMRRLHDARISCGFWVLDWKMGEGNDGQGAHVESVIFGREILMEDEKGHTKTALVQYALRRVSDTCLMTSFWMEPQHGTVKTRLSDEVDHNDKFHWSLKQAIGHTVPFENYESRGAHRNSTPRGNDRVSTSSSGSMKDEQKSMEQEDVSIDWDGGSTYLGESELLHLIRGYLFKSDRHFLSCLYTFDCIINLRENIEALNQLSKEIDGVVGSNWSMDRQLAAENGMILPPFSTARLLATSKRSTEHFLMYLHNDKSTAAGLEEPIPPAITSANENLYSMLELTLRGLSDCEVSWTDYSGDVVAEAGMPMSNSIEDDRFFREGMDGQLPLWLKHHLALTFKDRVPHHALSKGKCFAKLVSDDCVVLAFFPSLDTLRVQNKNTDKSPLCNSSDDFESKLNLPRKAPGKEEGHSTSTQQQFSLRAAEEDGTKSRVVRMSVSADDIVLYQERRRSFREGYKSWRMGHYQGSRDEKQSYGRDFQKLRLPSTPEDHEFCEEISRRASYGCDFHLLIESDNGVMGSGFFQVAFYECSLTRLSTDLHDNSNRMLDRADLPHTILKQLFFTKRNSKVREDRPALPLDRSGYLKKSPATRPPSDSVGIVQPRQSSDSILASRRFRKKVKRAHEHNFSRGVYMALREGGAVQHSDLLQALSSCIEVPVDVDITLLYRMMETAASHKILPLSPAAAAVVSAGIGADILKDKLTKSFETILSSVFVPIAGTKYYYFTGNENIVYEDLSSSEYDLHVLMEDSDDNDGEAAQKRDENQSHDENGTNDQGPELQPSQSGNAGTSRRSEKLDSEAGVCGGDKRVRRRRGSLGRELPPPAITSTEVNSSNEQHQANVEEDAEFNKEVAVATSSFSVPFFFRFECRVLNGSRDTRSNSADTHTSGVTPDSDVLRRSSSTAAYDDMRKDMVAQAQLTSPSSRQEEFNAFLTSLKASQVSRRSSTSADVSHIAESISDTPLGRIALRLVTLTLPNERAFDGGRVPASMPFEMDNTNGQVNKTNALPSMRTHDFSTLHLFQRQVLTRVRKDITEWCSIEILSILKSANEITPAIGSLVQRLFDDLPDDAVTKAKYSLEFVARSQETPVNPVDLFKREFEKGDLLNVHYCNGVYFVVENHKPADGIGVKSKTENSERTPDVTFEIPYWAYFELGSDYISLRLHHPGRLGISSSGFNRLEVLTSLQLGVRAVCRRVNQFLLLLQLHETRTCNGLLLPPNGNVPSSPRSPKRRNGSQGALDLMGGQDGLRKQAGFFWPGQFECDLRYSAFFKLHERLAPNFALNMLCTSALEQFQVHNRRHIFVYRDRDGHVFYMKISIYYDTTVSSVVGGQMTEERQERSVLARSSTGGSTGGTTATTITTPAGVPGIRLEVFGVSEAGEEVTHELCRLLERKLDEATQVVLMKLLARNTKFQLNQTDLAFLCPPDAPPASMVEYILPGEVSECSRLLHYLSQTLKLSPYVRPVASVPARNSREATSGSFRRLRRGSLASAGSTVSLPGEEFSRVKVQEHDHARGGKENATDYDSSRTHPACFGDYRKTLAKFQDDKEHLLFNAAIQSPVYFLMPDGVESDASSGHEPGCQGPALVAQTSYVLNLNPDLRLSPGFMSRVGKGLALMRVELIRNIATIDKSTEGIGLEDRHKIKHVQDVPGLAALYSNRTAEENAQDTILHVVRCQVWIRGSIHTAELSQVVEAFLDEALYDYHIEAMIRELGVAVQQQQQQYPGSGDVISGEEGHADLLELPGHQQKLPDNVDTLVSLFNSACLLPSSSVTSLGAKLSIAPWDIENAVAQVRSFLWLLPHHLRPAVYAKSKLSGAYELVASRNDGVHIFSNSSEPIAEDFRLIVKHVGDSDAYDDQDSSDSDAETTASMSSALHHIEPLLRTDSIHSEISDLDSVSGRMPLTWASTGTSSESNLISQIPPTAPSVSSTTSSSMVGVMASLSHQPHLPKNASFSERDVLLYSHNSSYHLQKSDSTETAEVKRSFYYVVDLSTSKGLQLYGYNMSTGLVEALATHLARVLTWSMLREKLLRSLLLEKSGLTAAAPIGSMVLQPRSLFLTSGRTDRTGKSTGRSAAVSCKDSAIHFIEYRPPVLTILQTNEWFPRVLDASRLRSIDGFSLGSYLREAQTQSASDTLDSLYQRPRGKSNTNMGAQLGPPSIPDLTREVSGPSLSQRSMHSSGDASNHSGGQVLGRTKSGGIVTGSNASDSVASSPSKRLSGPGPGVPYPGGSRNDAAARMRGGAGAATALMAARARARGGGFPGRIGGGPGISASRGASSGSSATAGDSVAPWDLPLHNTKGPRLHTSGDATDSNAVTGQVDDDTEKQSGSNSVALTGTLTTVKPSTRRRGSGHTDLGTASSSLLSGLPLAVPSAHRRSSKETTATDPGRIHSSWKKRLECAWGPRFLFPGSAERWSAKITTERRLHFMELEDEEEVAAPKKGYAPLPFFCAALEKRWEAFETRSTSHTVGINLLGRLASMRDNEEMEEPVAKDVVANMVASGHLLLHQRFRAAFVERWVAGEMVGTTADEDGGGSNNRLLALRSCMDLVNLLSYKREFVFDSDECSVAKLYTEHTVLSMSAGAGADVRGIKQQVAANLEPLRLEVAGEFYKEFAVHLRTLGFRQLRTINTSRIHARAFPVEQAAANEGDTTGGEGFSEYFYHPERTAAEAGGWKVDPQNNGFDSYPLSVVVLEVKCDHRGVRLTAVLVSIHDLEQQDLRFQDRLAAKTGKRYIAASGPRIQGVSTWLRAQLKTQALIYGFTIRYFQQHLLQWIDAAHDFHDNQSGPSHSVGKHLGEDDALVATPPIAWKKTSTFQNIIKGIQCFLHAFPAPPEEVSSPAGLLAKSTSKIIAETTTSAKSRGPMPKMTSTPPSSGGSRSSLRQSRLSRRAAAKHHQQPVQNASSGPRDAVTKTTTPLSSLWHDCVIRMETVALQPTSLHSNCVESILVQILLRYIACHGSRYEVLDLLQFGTPDAVVCHSSSGSFFHRPPSTIIPTIQSRKMEPTGGYSLVITTQPLTRKSLDKDSVQLLLLKSTPSALGVGNGVLPVERALQEAQLFTRELFRVAAQHYERDLLWSRLLFDDTRGPGAEVARTLALPADLFRVEVGPQQLEECLKLSICTPLETLDPRLDELLRVSGVCWQELALRLRDIYADQLREFQFQEEDENSSHLLLLCPDTFDLIIHLTFVTPKDNAGAQSGSLNDGEVSVSDGESIDSSSRSASINGSHVSSIDDHFSESGFGEEAQGDLRVEICRREEPPNKQFTFAQRRSISEFVNCIVHWQWRSLIYD
ncbi:unnamed protein product [Phytophthora fragariaefolia]|uniref:Unnamed protein product n=1 Tax=Phytophthora fragariaefolia TaxID=1490495 RepID=A0A9W6WUA9_9STRA|nr:unnamed protein product [Phytophthora fragariaefolia]